MRKGNEILSELWLHQKRLIAKEISFYLAKIVNKATENRGIAFGEFMLVSGRRSPYYIDIRTMYTYPKVFERVSDALSMMIKYEIMGYPILTELDEELKPVEKVDKLAGVPTAGLGLTQAIAMRLGLPWFYCKEKVHGAGSIQGSLEKGDNVVVIDDLITTAKSKMESIRAIREVGGKVNYVVVVVDREEGGMEELKKEKINLLPIVKIRELVNNLKDFGIIGNDEVKKAKDYIKEKRKEAGLA